jgi:hypothetical protein
MKPVCFVLIVAPRDRSENARGSTAKKKGVRGICAWLADHKLKIFRACWPRASAQGNFRFHLKSARIGQPPSVAQPQIPRNSFVKAGKVVVLDNHWKSQGLMRFRTLKPTRLYPLERVNLAKSDVTAAMIWSPSTALIERLESRISLIFI